MAPWPWRGRRCRPRRPAALALAPLLLAAGPVSASAGGGGAAAAGLRGIGALVGSIGWDTTGGEKAPAALQQAAALPRTIVPIEELPLSVRGPHVVGVSGKRVRLFCVNWYGAHMEQMVVNGLNRQPLERIAATIAEMGFNCVRLPFSLEMVLGNHARVPDPKYLAANPSLQDLDPRELYDRTVRALTDVGLLVFLNVHTSGALWCCTGDDGEGLWYTEEWPESEWLRALTMLSGKYRDNRRVAGFDLRNEVRVTALGRPTWGTGDPKTDWAAASVRGGQAVLAANGDMLIIISALLYGMFLCDLPRWQPHVQFPELKGKTVYTTHDYSWYHFHHVARGTIGGLLTTFAIACGVLVLLVVLEFAIHMLRPKAHGRLICVLRHCGGLRCAEWELVAASALSIIALVALMLGEHWLFYGCGDYNLAKTMVALFLAPLLGFIALALWIRAAAACATGAHRGLCERLGCAEQQATLAPPQSVPEIELTKKASLICQDRLADGEGAAREMTLTASAEKPGTAAPAGLPRHTLASFVLSWRCLLPAPVLITFGAVLTAHHHYGTYAAFQRELDLKWGLPPTAKVRPQDVPPIWVGEFGTGGDDEWWQNFVRYLRERDLDWAYWAFNGEKRFGEGESFGLLDDDWSTVRHPWKLEALQDLIRNMSAV